MLTEDTARAIVRDELHASPYAKAMQIVGHLMIDLIQSPQGAQTCANYLRDAGWVCTPPAARKRKERRG